MKKIAFLSWLLIAALAWFATPSDVSALGGTKIRYQARDKITEQTLVSGTEYSISSTAGTSANHTHDIYLWNTSADTTEAYWKLKGSFEGSVDADGATLTASTGAILLLDVPGTAVLDWSGASGKMVILSGGDR